MLIIPAIDLRKGRCVRLSQGDMQSETVYSKDPVRMARHWAAAGARRLHVIDLDGAVHGTPKNAEVIHAIVESLPELPVQVGGGVRSAEIIQAYLEAGAHYVIIGTRAVTTPHFITDACVEFPGRIIVSLDSRDGRLATEGWSKLSRHTVLDVAVQLAKEGVEAIIFTDINRDGMLKRINVEATLELCRSVHVPVVAAGGLTDLEDVKELSALVKEGLLGAVAGRSIYEKTLDFAAAQRLADSLDPPGEASA